MKTINYYEIQQHPQRMDAPKPFPPISSSQDLTPTAHSIYRKQYHRNLLYKYLKQLT